MSTKLRLQDLHITKIVMQGGDLIVITIPNKLTQPAYVAMKDALHEFFPENKVIFFEDGVRLDVYTPVERAAL